VPPPCTRDGRTLDGFARARLLAALERDDAVCERFVEWLDPIRLREHAWAVVDAWAERGSDPRCRWVLAGLRLVSDDELEERLVPACDLEEATASGVLGRELDRLERALSTGRDWVLADWRHWLLEHRLMRHIVPTLVWGQRSSGRPGRLTRTFRVDGQGALVDAEHAPVHLEARQRVCLVHPSELRAPEAAAWGECVAELELIPPFAQLSRGRALDPREASEETVQLLSGPPIDAMRAKLRRRGWIAGEPDRAMRVRYFTKSFVRHDVYGVVVITPGLGRGTSPQRTRAAFFLERLPGGLSFDREPKLPLTEVPAIALSEVLYDIDALEA